MMIFADFLQIVVLVQKERMQKKEFDLENRLIEYSVSVISIIRKMSKDSVSLHLASQLIRSSTSVSLHYGEAQGAESRRDFIHKMKVILKELRESLICLKLIRRFSLPSIESPLQLAIIESSELVAIFIKSIETARKNLEMSKQK